MTMLASPASSKNTAIPLASTLLMLSGCAHSYYYTPEIAGEGARVGRGGVVIEIPPKDPAIKLKLLSLGVTTPPREPHNGAKALQIRMLFVRTPKGADTPVSVDTADLKLAPLGDDDGILPGLVHAASHQGSIVELGPMAKQAVDVWFPLPRASRGAADIQYFTLRWKIHYGANLAEEQVTRFDRQDSRSQQSAELFPWDADFPYDVSPVLPPGWIYDPWPWWEPFPFLWR